jgi:hypothetical protein
MMDDAFTWVRALNFTWAFCLFFAMVYFGVMDIFLTRRCPHLHTPREWQYWILAAFLANLAIILSLAEIFLLDVTGGWRVFAIWPFLALTTVSITYTARRVRSHRASIASGECG